MLDDLEVPYVLGGSLASSAFGEPRSTNDVDIATRMTPAQLNALIEQLLEDGYYVPTEHARTALAQRTSFNVVHPGGLKVDLFVHGDGLLDRLQMERRVRIPIDPVSGTVLWVTSPSDQVLRKLDWYRLGREASDRQWRDIIGLLRAQRHQVDYAKLADAAGQLDLTDLLRRALAAADGETQDGP